MKCLVYLGNPGAQYYSTRHNVGFLIGESFILNEGFIKKGEKFKSIIFEKIINGEKVLAVFPQTYMNLSGEAVSAVGRYFNIEPENILTVYDDIDLEFGVWRIRKKGGPGTHNGMKSMVAHLGKNFPRLRIGVGPKPENTDSAKYVLSNFKKTELEKLEEFQKDFEAIFLDFCSIEIDNVMNRHNKKSG